MTQRIQITVSQENLDWIDSLIEKGIFASRSHAFNYLGKRMMEGKIPYLEQEVKKCL